jgi:GNAT superfamily N-acetyltransferase
MTFLLKDRVSCPGNGSGAGKRCNVGTHAYILPHLQKQGIGSKLFDHIKKNTTTPRLLVGTWADARWAVAFYQKHGFKLAQNKDELLKTYWDISPRQIETSVVLELDLR